MLKLAPCMNFSKYLLLYILCIFTRLSTPRMVFFMHFAELFDTVMGI
jgi:hypothetical protein